MEEDATARRKRKQEAKELKRKRIEEAGGIRPRKSGSKDSVETKSPRSDGKQSGRQDHGMQRGPNHRIRHKNAIGQSHRFGGVMEQVPCRNRPRFSTLSIALPGSIVSNCQTRELKTHLVGQIARAAAVYHVDEIVVFDDKLSSNQRGDRGGYYQGPRHRRPDNGSAHGGHDEGIDGGQAQEREHHQRKSDPHTFMARVLQYCECPQYLRRHFFPMHPDLQFAGLLSPIDAPHHVRADERSKYREGVVLDKTGPDGKSLVNCGIRGRPVEIDRLLSKGIRCTVKLDPSAYKATGQIRGTVVSPSAPREDNGTYWGYTTRLAESIHAIFHESPYEGGYDLKIGTSERGNVTVDDKKFTLQRFQHALVVFGGVAGIEECVDADETLKIPGSESKKLFDIWVNSCPFQGSRTIRTEEAVLITLARLSPFVADNMEAADHIVAGDNRRLQDGPTEASVEFSDEGPSEESSDRDDN